ncbi:MAG: hypothetical protein LC800_03935 [Acidobacteria bacterium]|nr:hypothetical protein [Acidobacteriota bacterium]
MRRPVALVLIIIALANFNAPPLAAQPQAREAADARRLDNAGLEAMIDAGLAPDIIAAKIKSSEGSFDTSAEALRRLKAKGATDEVLLAIVRSAVGPRTAGPHQPAPTPAATPSTGPPAASNVLVPAGTPVEIEAAHPINSAEVRAGDTLRFRVVRAVEVGGTVVIAQGAVATARVVAAHKGRPFGKAGRLAFEMRDVDGVDGQSIPLSFAESLRGNSKGGTVAAAVALTALFAFPLAPLWGFKRGKSAVVPAGKIFAAAVRAATPVGVGPKR